MKVIGLVLVNLKYVISRIGKVDGGEKHMNIHTTSISHKPIAKTMVHGSAKPLAAPCPGA